MVFQKVAGTLVSGGVPLDLNLGFVPTTFRLWNKTAFNGDDNPGVTKHAWYQEGLAAGEAFTIKNTNNALTDQSLFLTSGGFTVRQGGEELLGPALTVTSITQAAAAVVTITSHGLNTGDVVRLYGTTAMLQIAGQDYVVTRIDANTFSIPVNSSGFAAAATGGTARKVIVGPAFAPRNRTVTNVTAANPAVITTSTNHGYLPGEQVRLLVPAGWGMVEANNKLVRVVSVTANTITTDLDTSGGFTTFAYPTSATAAAGISFPQVVPVGDDAVTLSGAVRNQDFDGIHLGVGVCGAASDELFYQAEVLQF